MDVISKQYYPLEIQILKSTHVKIYLKNCIVKVTL